MSGLSPLGKKLLIGALIVIIIALFDRLLLSPTKAKSDAIDDEIAKEKETIKQDLHFLKYKNKILKESDEAAPYISKAIPSEDQIITTFLKKIESLAAKANVTQKTSTPVGVQEDNDMKYSADVEASGKLEDIVTFIHLINSSDELAKVVKFNLGSKKADSDEIKSTLTISKIIVTKELLSKPPSSTSADSQSNAANTKPN